MTWLILIMNLITALIAAKKRVLPYSILTVLFTFIVAGQAVQIQSDLTRSSSVYYAYSRVTEHGFKEALWYVFIASSVSLILAALARGYDQSQDVRPLYRVEPSGLFYAILLTFECLVATVLVFGVVGVSAFVHASRPGNQPGATLFITLMSVGFFPVLYKISYREKVNKADLLCLAISLVVTAGFSRLHVILYSFVIVVALYYGRAWAARPFSYRMASLFVIAGAVLAVFFFTFGALRDAQNFVKGGSIKDLIDYNLEHPEKSLLSLEYTYRVSVEGMSGIAGALSDAEEDPGQVRRDWGVSTGMDGIGQMLPAFVKHLFQEQMDTVQSWYWYKKPGGNVSPGIETAFVSFGWLGAFLYPCIIFAFGWTIPMKLLSVPVTPPLKLTVLLAIGCEVFAVRGKWSDWIAFSFSYGIITFLFWPLFSMCFTRAPLERNAHG